MTRTLLKRSAFDLTSGSAATITLDFDGDKARKKIGIGNCMMTPVVSIGQRKQGDCGPERRCG